MTLPQYLGHLFPNKETKMNVDRHEHMNITGYL